MNQITMLGTGNATVSQIYNTCFLLQTSSTLMLVDAGGGNGILSQLKKVNVQISDIHHLFVTHAHTDHVLGVIWVIRMVALLRFKSVYLEMVLLPTGSPVSK